MRVLARLPTPPYCDAPLTPPARVETMSRHVCVLMSMAQTSGTFPCFHARFQGDTIEVPISPVGDLRGTPPSVQTAPVLVWAQKCQRELNTKTSSYCQMHLHET